MAYIRISGVSKRYGEKVALDQTDLEVRQGEFLSILGPSGCGNDGTMSLTSLARHGPMAPQVCSLRRRHVPLRECSRGRRVSSTVFFQLLPFFALTRFWGVCFRSQRLRLARLMGEFSDGFLTVVAVTAMRYGLRGDPAGDICSNRSERESHGGGHRECQ